MPIDGAKIILVTGTQTTPQSYDMWSFTDKDGNCSLPVGEGIHFHARVESPVGNYPPGSNSYSYLTLTVDGGSYDFLFPVSGDIMPSTFNEIAVPKSDNDWLIRADFFSTSQVISAGIPMDDLNATTNPPRFYKVEDNGDVNLFFANENDYLMYRMYSNFDSYLPEYNVSMALAEFDVPDIREPWYVILDNDNVSNCASLQGYIALYHYGPVGNKDNTVPKLGAQLLSNRPNPFNPETTISFTLADNGYTELEVFNVKGQLVKTLVRDVLYAGMHQFSWDGTNEQGVSTGSGVYFYTLKTGTKKITKKMLLLK
ncbi:MAG: T9SS type A sorting domain-containing protein [Candidatus Cloacimonetes bacterium]|nr:T9SS type A sorting domain-containing protein [Candidatus Cloacimonadota bacterium]